MDIVTLKTTHQAELFCILKSNLICSIILPKDYDKDKVYHVYFLTDAVWRFGDALTLSKKADEGKCGDVIFVTLGFGYHLDGSNKQTCDSDYGYWDRKQTLDKDVFLCAGSQEGLDYTDLYNGNPTTLEGLSALKERLDKHNKQCKYKLYDSHHYQYIPEMLDEWLTEHYAK